MAEEFDANAVAAVRMLIEREHDAVPCLEPIEHRVERVALGEDAQTAFAETARHHRIEPRGLERRGARNETGPP